MIRRLVLTAAVAGLAAVPAHAGTFTYGSGLTATANLTDSHTRDWAAWPVATTPASAGGYRVTEAGEIAKVAFRGSILADGVPPGFVFHIVVLRPQADGSVKLMVASADFASRFVGIDPQAVTTVDLQQNAERMCALPGDVVALATSGGYDPAAYPNGVPVQMFSRVPTSSYAVAKSAGTFQVGGTETPAQQDGAELLMRVTVGTGTDARPTCRVAGPPTPTPTPTSTPSPAPEGPAVSIPAPAKALPVRRGRVTLSVACLGPGACAGTLTLSRAGKAYGKAHFSAADGAAAHVKVKLTKAGRKGHGRVTVKAVAVTTGGDRVTRRLKISR